jgi:hypothetical protein
LAAKFISPGCCQKSYGTIVWKLQNTRAVFGEGSRDEHRNPGIRGPERTGWAVYTRHWRTFEGRTIYQMRSVEACPECGKDLTTMPKTEGIEVHIL